MVNLRDEIIVVQGPVSLERRGTLSLLAREPFLHFVLLGAALFALNYYLQERARFSRITITQDQVSAIVDNYRLQYGELPSSHQLTGLVDNYIQEEMSYREALKLGLDAGDEIVRRRLVQKYKFLQQDLAMPAEPTESDLRAWYRQYPDKYLHPQTVTFSHVFFSTDIRGEVGAREAAQVRADDLNRRGLFRAGQAGDRFPGTSNFIAASRDELMRAFGKEGLAESIFNVTPNRWSAPLRSGFGWHTVYVSALRPSQEATFDEVRQRVRVDYLDAERARRNAEAFAKLRGSFSIICEGG